MKDLAQASWPAKELTLVVDAIWRNHASPEDL
jgi:hypothetical protein